MRFNSSLSGVVWLPVHLLSARDRLRSIVLNGVINS